MKICCFSVCCLLVLFSASFAVAEAPPSPVSWTVEAAINEGLVHAGSIRIKDLEIVRTEAAVMESRALLLPHLSLTASGSYMTNPPKGIKISQGAFGTAPSPGNEFPVSFPPEDYVLVKDPEHTYFKVTGTFEQVLFTWGKAWKAACVADLSRQVAVVDLVAAKRDQRKTVRSTYFGAVFARDSAAILREVEDLLRQIVVDRESRFEQGLITTQNVLEAKSRAAQVRSGRIKAEQGLATALAAMEFHTGKVMMADSLVSGFHTTMPDFKESGLADSLFNNSPDLDRLGLQLKQARLGEEIRAGGQIFMPDLSLNIGLDITGQKIPFIGGNWTDTWNANLIFSIGTKINLWDSGDSWSKLQQASARRQEAEIGEVEMRRGLVLKLRQAVQAVNEQAAEVERLDLAMQLAAEQDKNARVAFESDAATREDTRGAHAAFLQAKLELLLGQFQLENAIGELEYQTGSQL